jgi:hypothetical protein
MLDKFAHLATDSGKEITGTSKGQNADTANDTPAHNTAELHIAGATATMLPQDVHSVLMRLRMRFPGMPILGIPNTMETAVLAAGVAQNIDLNRMAVAVMFHASSPFYVNFKGAAKIPNSSSNGNADFLARDSLLITPPWPFLYYAQGKYQISVIAENPATVQTLCFVDGVKEQ